MREGWEMKRLQLVLTEKNYDFIRKTSDQSGLSMSDLIRRMLDKAEKKERMSIDVNYKFWE